MSLPNPLADYHAPDLPRTDVFPDPANDSLEHVFAPLRQQWVWDFFFECNEKEADMLKYAVADQFVTLADFQVNTRDTPDPYANSFRVCEQHRVLLLPSFSTGSLSVGFGVNERITSSSTFACRERYTGRIVRDDHNGTVLFIAEDDNINMVEVSFFSLCSTTQREHKFLIFHRSKFRSAIRSIRTKYSHKAVKNSLMYYYHAIEGRSCPNCGKNNCFCRLAIQPKRHPLDRESELANVSSYTGHYGGVASLGLYTKGSNVFLARYNASSGIRINADFSTQQKLALWALCSAAQKRPVNPVKLIMSEAANMKNRVVTATDTFLLASLAEEVVDPPSDRDTGNAGAMMTAADMLSDGIPAPGVAVGGAIAQMSAVAGLGGFDINSFLGDVCDLTAGGDLDFIDVGLSDGLSDGPSSTTPSSESVKRVGDVDMTTAVSDSHEAVAVNGLAQAAPAVKRAARPLLPAAQEEDGATDDGEMDERRRKAELRKARNRESAQRSNLKRKMQIQKLKDEMDAATTRENYLRAKEKMLREENLSLRTAVYR